MGDSVGSVCEGAALAGGGAVSFSSFLGCCPMIPAASSFFSRSFTLGASAAALAARAGVGVGVGVYVGVWVTALGTVTAGCGGIMGMGCMGMFGAPARWMPGAPISCCGVMPGKPCGFIPCGTETQKATVSFLKLRNLVVS